MYPDPHIPSAPTERYAPRHPSHPPRRVLLLVVSAALAVLAICWVSFRHHPTDHSDNDDALIVTEHSDHIHDPRFSTRVHPTRLP